MLTNQYVSLCVYGEVISAQSLYVTDKIEKIPLCNAYNKSKKKEKKKRKK